MPDHDSKIEVIGSSSADLCLSIRALLGSKQKKLVHGEQFTGRPSTHIYSDDKYVIKVHSEFHFAERDARRWIDQALDKEQRLAVHHPEKRWFLIFIDNKAAIANITPLLFPIHQLHKQLPLDQMLDYLMRMLKMYLTVAASYGDLLDGGLSNYAIDAQDNFYYVDDDIYRWDNFTSLGQTLGFWVRALGWFDLEMAEYVGSELAYLLPELFSDRHTSVVLAGHLRSAHYTDETRQARRDAILKGLLPKQTKIPLVKVSNDRPLALISDLHANYAALQAVQQQLDKLEIQDVLVLGDIVGYGPNPLECVNEVRERGYTVIKGNHDYACVEANFTRGFSTHAQYVAEWTRTVLDQEALVWLDELPPYIENEEWLAVHGSPQDRSYLFGYVYKMTYESNLDNLASRQIPICFHGHTHIQGVYYRGKSCDEFSDAAEQNLANYSHALVCPGSVGQPRERKGAAARYAIYYPQSKRLELKQVEYDVNRTMQDMRDLHFPPALSERLAIGM